MSDLTLQDLDGRWMTVKELAETLGVDERTIRRYAGKLRTELSGVTNTQGGYLFTESDVTLIKLHMQQNSHIKDVAELPKTALEKRLLVQQAMQILNDEIEDLKAELETARPKIEFFDQVTDSTDALDMGEAAKVLNMGIGRNSLFAFLREEGILQDNNQPYQRYIDRGYFRTIEQKFTKPDGSVSINIKTVVYQSGLDFIRKLYKGRV